ncbi:acyl-CoA dehydrogenase family protein [Amycolatopsis sp. NPDC051106]|uniref:acyl-CoA dehydrogenase family protein n=1 Tax=unclassified Amycolatopsis TaxID=2618356 RepID=UPI003412DA66
MTTKEAGDAAESLLEAARTTAERLAAEAAATERDRRVTDASFAAARAAGAFALSVRRSDGGIDADLTTRVRFLGELGRGCPSTAWIAATTVESKRVLRVGVSDEAYADAFGDVDTVVCGSARLGRGVREPGGLRISGRWAYASGCEHAEWAMLPAQLPGDGDGQPQTVAVFVRTRELVVDRDDWQVAGLGGTGSHTLVGDDVWIPDSHVLDLARINDASSNLPIAVGLFAPLWGAARGALDVVAAVLAERPSPNPAHATLADSPGARRNFAVAAYKIDTAERRMLGIATTIDATPPGETLAADERARLRMDLITAVRECRSALDDLLDLHGSSGLFSSNPLQRYWRDFAVGSRHVQFTSHVVEEDYGVLLLGVDDAPSGML